MSTKDTVVLDSKGRIVIPLSMREILNLKTNEKLILTADTKKIIIEPAHEKKLLSLEIALSDDPGSLAQAATALAKINVDLISTQSRSSSRGERAIWSVECIPHNNSISKIRTVLSKVGAKLLSASWK